MPLFDLLWWWLEKDDPVPSPDPLPLPDLRGLIDPNN
jgi:hypothetical protein